MFLDFASDTIGLQRSRDSAIEQLVLAFEKASVAAVNNETSIVFEGIADSIGRTSPSLLNLLDDISFGSSVDVMDPRSPVSPFSCPNFGDGGGVANPLGLSAEASSLRVLESDALRKASSPLRLGTRKLYAIEAGA